MGQIFAMELKKGNADQNLPIKSGLSDNDRKGALVVVVGSGVHVQMEPVVASADRGDGVAGHRVGGEVGRFTITIVFGSHGWLSDDHDQVL